LHDKKPIRLRLIVFSTYVLNPLTNLGMPAEMGVAGICRRASPSCIGKNTGLESLTTHSREGWEQKFVASHLWFQSANASAEGKYNNFKPAGWCLIYQKSNRLAASSLVSAVVFSLEEDSVPVKHAKWPLDNNNKLLITNNLWRFSQEMIYSIL